MLRTKLSEATATDRMKFEGAFQDCVERAAADGAEFADLDLYCALRDLNSQVNRTNGGGAAMRHSIKLGRRRMRPPAGKKTFPENSHGSRMDEAGQIAMGRLRELNGEEFETSTDANADALRSVANAHSDRIHSRIRAFVQEVCGV